MLYSVLVILYSLSFVRYVSPSRLVGAVTFETVYLCTSVLRWKKQTFVLRKRQSSILQRTGPPVTARTESEREHSAHNERRARSPREPRADGDAARTCARWRSLTKSLSLGLNLARSSRRPREART